MTQPTNAMPAGTSSGVTAGYRWLATIFALLVIAQAFLGMRGYLGKPNLVDVHEMLANLMFLLAVGQTVLAWLLYRRSAIVLGLNALLVLLTIAQIGLGYSSIANEKANFISLISLHVPNGVLLMGVSTALAAMAWQLGARRSAA